MHTHPESGRPRFDSQLKMAINKLSKDHNDNKDKISITENTNETKFIKGLLTDLRTKIEGMEEKIRDLERDLAFERNKRIEMENELEDICKREHWESVSRTMVVTGLDKQIDINTDIDRVELRTELKKHFGSMRDELQNTAQCSKERRVWLQ